MTDQTTTTTDAAPQQVFATPIPTSVFAPFRAAAYPHRYAVTIHVATLCGGTPTDPKVAEGWLRSKVTAPDDLIREEVAKVMTERGVSSEEAAAEVDANKHLNGFKRRPGGELYVEGRILKAALKEAANIRWSDGRWTITPDGKAKVARKTAERTPGKATRNWMAEHLFVEEHIIGLGVSEPSGINQRFVQTWRGSGISYEEFVNAAELNFTVATDAEFSDEIWQQLWLTAEEMGVGATRSQGFGRFAVTGWTKL